MISTWQNMACAKDLREQFIQKMSDTDTSLTQLSKRAQLGTAAIRRYIRGEGDLQINSYVRCMAAMGCKLKIVDNGVSE